MVKNSIKTLLSSQTNKILNLFQDEFPKLSNYLTKYIISSDYSIY